MHPASKFVLGAIAGVAIAKIAEKPVERAIEGAKRFLSGLKGGGGGVAPDKSAPTSGADSGRERSGAAHDERKPCKQSPSR